MKKIDLGQAIGILANLGVIAGILFLALELRQNNEYQSAEVRARMLANRVSVTDLLFEYPEVIELLAKNQEELADAELARIRLLGSRIILQLEWNFGEAKRGFQDQDALATRYRNLFSQPMWNSLVLLSWETAQLNVDEDFRVWFTDEVIRRIADE